MRYPHTGIVHEFAYFWLYQFEWASVSLTAPFSASTPTHTHTRNVCKTSSQFFSQIRTYRGSDHQTVGQTLGQTFWHFCSTWSALGCPSLLLHQTPKQRQDVLFASKYYKEVFFVWNQTYANTNIVTLVHTYQRSQSVSVWSQIHKQTNSSMRYRWEYESKVTTWSVWCDTDTTQTTNYI